MHKTNTQTKKVAMMMMMMIIIIIIIIIIMSHDRSDYRQGLDQ
jgi:predicted nucleic acid-binding Zn ribbon protein